MALRSGFGQAQPEFDMFLSAVIGDDSNGMPLTVQSALARLDRDPRSEAGRFCSLSQDAAMRSMTDVIESLPAGSWTKMDVRELASELLTRLPQRRQRVAPAPNGDAKPRKVYRVPALRLLISAAFAAAVAYAIWGTPAADRAGYMDLSSLSQGASAILAADARPQPKTV